MAETRLSDFSEVDGVVTFALLQGYSAHFYQRTGTTGGLEELDTVTRGDLRGCHGPVRRYAGAGSGE